MEFDEKLEICQEEMAKEFGISEDEAKSIISDMDIEDLIFSRYEDSIKEKENEKQANWELERKLNPDLY